MSLSTSHPDPRRVVGIADWKAFVRDNHADHLRTLARPLIETLTDERQRAHLTHILDGTTGDSPSCSARYRPHSVITR